MASKPKIKKTAFITGASRGIGAAAAQCLASQGWQIAACYLESERLMAELMAAWQGQGYDVLALRGDVRKQKDVLAMLARIEERFDSVDVLVNNAGIARQELFTDVTEEEWDRMFDVHVKGAFHCCQAVLPAMIRRKSGKIINISSIWGLTGASCEVAYSAAKGALIAFTKALAKEVGPSGIQVNCIAPGVIETEMNTCLCESALAALREETPLGRLGKPEEVAYTISFLASPAADFMTGQVLSPNGGLLI